MIPIRDKKTDISSEVAQGEVLQKKMVSLAAEAADESISSGTDLNAVIASIAKRESFNRIQIQRLVEESNTVAYNKRYDKLRSSHDRRITFPIASLDGVIKEMGFGAPPAIVNPNLPEGGQGEGEMAKSASTQIESTPIHSPHSGLEKRHQAYLDKVASVQRQKDERAYSQTKKERDSTIFKIANSLVMTEKQYKTANVVFNTLLSDVDMSEESKDGIIKKASDLAEHMVKTKRLRPGFMVTLRQNPEEKIANHVLGEYSLVKQAEDSLKVKEVKVQPTVDVSDFNHLVELARKLEAQQNILANAKQPAIAGSEVK